MSTIEELESIHDDLVKAEGEFYAAAEKMKAESDSFDRTKDISRLKTLRTAVEKLRSEYNMCRDRLEPT
jgi:hypothetical protein